MNVIFKLQGPIHAPVLMVVINKQCISRLLYIFDCYHPLFSTFLKNKTNQKDAILFKTRDL